MDTHTASPHAQPSWQRMILPRIALIALAVGAFTGALGSALDFPMGTVQERNQAFLEDSMRQAVAWGVGVAGARGVIAVLASVDVGPVRLGAVLDPVADILGDLMEFIALSAGLVVAQMAVLAFIKLVALKYVLALGALSSALDYRRGSFFGTAGYALIAFGVILYIAYPIALHAGASAHEAHHVRASARLGENVGILKEQATDLRADLTDGPLTEIAPKAEAAASAISAGVRLTWESLVDVAVGFVIMFVLTPLLALGGVYMLARHALASINATRAGAALEGAVGGTVRRIGHRTRARWARQRKHEQ